VDEIVEHFEAIEKRRQEEAESAKAEAKKHAEEK
jgi:hypothetical protein